MVKRFLLIPLMIVLVSGLILGGCAAPAPAPAPEKIFEFDFAGIGPLTHGIYQGGLLPWKQDIEEASGGRIKINIYTDGVLAPPDECYPALKEGMVDMTFFRPGFTPGVFPVSEVIDLPFLGPSSCASNTLMLYDMWEQFSEFRAEYDDIKVLFMFGTDGAGPSIDMKTHMIRKLEDFEGTVIACFPGHARIFEMLGAAPAPMDYGEIYTAVDKGVADGLSMSWETLVLLKYYEVTKYHTNFPFATGIILVAMDKGKWEEMPPDLQEILMEESEKASLRIAEVGYQLPMMAGIRFATETPGHEVYFLDQEDPAEWARIMAVTEPLYEEWINMVVDRGVMSRERAQQLIDACRASAAKHNPKYENWMEKDYEAEYNMTQYDHWQPGWGL